MAYDIHEYLGDVDDLDPDLDNSCPKCGREYGEIDYEYQICHFCKYVNQ